MPTGRDDELVRSFDVKLNEISLHATMISVIAARETREGQDIRAAGSLTERALETFEVMLDELLIDALSVNVTVRRDILEAAEERRESR